MDGSDTRGESVAPLRLDAFVAHLGAEMSFDPTTVRGSTRFVEDLDFDSVQMLELSIVVEELGVELDDEDLDNLTSIELAHNAYLKQVTRGRR